MEASIQRDHTQDCELIFEHDIVWNGNSYLTIYGKHINGGFIAIPDWKICCEASAFPDDVFYNTEKLTQAGMDKSAAKAIAVYIKK